MKRSSINRGKSKLKRSKLRRRRAIRIKTIKGEKENCTVPPSLLRRKPTRSLRAKPDPKMAAWSKEVLERDGHHCRWPECSEHGDHIRGHHINEKSQRPDLKYDIDNGAAMCPVHHDRLHHTVEGRTEAKRLGLLGGETYEKALRAA